MLAPTRHHRPAAVAHRHSRLAAVRPVALLNFGLGGHKQQQATTKSVDPAAASSVYTPGNLLAIHSPADVDRVLADNRDKLVVVQCKSSHCKPCKAFAKKYMELAGVFKDSVLAEITGDASQVRVVFVVAAGR